MRDAHEKKLSRTLYYSIFLIFGYVLIANLFHIIYLNQYEEYDFDSERIKEIKLEVDELKANIKKIDNLSTKYISSSDLTTIKSAFAPIVENLDANEFLSLTGKKKYYFKDIIEYDALSNPKVLMTINLIKVLGKYDEEMSTYTKVYTSSVVSDIYGQNTEVYEAYKYNTLDIWNAALTDNTYLYRVQTRVLKLEYFVNNSLYLSEQVLKIGGGNND